MLESVLGEQARMLGLQVHSQMEILDIYKLAHLHSQLPSGEDPFCQPIPSDLTREKVVRVVKPALEIVLGFGIGPEI